MNFYKELYESISSNNVVNSTINNDNDNCLITHEPLKHDHITLKCGHKFNYHPLYLEVINQKCKYNTLEVQLLKAQQIKCPYCRNIQDYILPPSIHYNLIKNVNKPTKYCMVNSNCCYIVKSGINKGKTCDKSCYGKVCYKHSKQFSNELSNEIIGEIIELEKEMGEKLQESKDLYSHIKRNSDVCIHEDCIHKSIGKSDKCFKHMNDEDKGFIRNVKVNRNKCAKNIRRIKQLIDEKSI